MTSARSGIVVIDRLWMFRREGRDPAPVLNLTREQAFKAYRGFDGLPWPDSNHAEIPTNAGLAPLTSLSSVRQYLARGEPGAWDMILVSSREADSRLRDPVQLVPLGIDIGYFESEWSVFSSILNEIVFGTQPRMADFASRLNRCLLFSNLEDANAALAVRTELLSTDADLERDGLPLSPYWISSVVGD